MRRVASRPKNYNAGTFARSYVSRVRRERDPIPWRYCLMVLFCVAFLASGFIYAAKQHFEAMDYSIKNEKLLKQIEELENEQRRLKLQREEALSPAEVKKTALKLGFREISAENFEIVKKTNRNFEEKSEFQESRNKKNESQKSADDALLASSESDRRNKVAFNKNSSPKDDKNSNIQKNAVEKLEQPEKPKESVKSAKDSAVKKYAKNGKSSVK
jgi:cell division protein FtsL